MLKSGWLHSFGLVTSPKKERKQKKTSNDIIGGNVRDICNGIGDGTGPPACLSLSSVVK